MSVWPSAVTYFGSFRALAITFFVLRAELFSVFACIGIEFLRGFGFGRLG